MRRSPLPHDNLPLPHVTARSLRVLLLTGLVAGALPGPTGAAAATPARSAASLVSSLGAPTVWEPPATVDRTPRGQRS